MRDVSGLPFYAVAEVEREGVTGLDRLIAVIAAHPKILGLGGRGQIGEGDPAAQLAADLVLIPVQPSPLDGWASAEMLALLAEARIYRPQLLARFVLNRCAARTVIARETAETLADHDPPLMSATIGQRVAFADLAQSGRLVFEADDNSAAAREIAALTAEVGRLAP